MSARELWDEVVGQPGAVDQLRSAVRSPVHAYLLVGPDGSGRRAAARAFTADLLADGLGGDAERRTRELVAAESHPSMFVFEREGASLSVEQADEIVRRASLAPPEGDLQVLVVTDVHLVREAGPKLLKIVEEPPPTTAFVLLAEELPPELATIESRCVRVEFAAVALAAIIERLVADGVAEEVAETVAAAAGGSLARARLLARDPAVTTRRDAWYRVPERLDGSGHAACAAVDELLELVGGVLEPLAEQQSEELERFLAAYEAAGLDVPKGQLATLESRHKREQRKVRVDELKSGLAVLVSRYRDELVRGGSSDDFVNAAERVQQLCDDLAFNPNESLALQALFVSVPSLSIRA